MQADIIHISGFDTYHTTHDSGNYIVFNYLRELGYDSKMILAIQKLRPDDDTFLIPKDRIIETIESAKVIVLHDSLFTHHEIKKLHDKLNCQIVMVTMDHSLIFSHDCCGNLAYPELSTESDKIKNRSMIIERANVLSSVPITIVPVSSRSKEIFKNSAVFANKDFVQIPLPPDIPFCSSNKETVRKHLGLKSGKKYILWGTSQPQCERKGKKLFDECLDILWKNLDEASRQQIVIVNVGPPAGRFGINSNFSAIYFGYQETRKKMSIFYRACDISICTTTSDAGPMMISESMCNETPVIAFDRSVSLDLCENEETGYLIRNLDLNEMSNSINKILFEDDLEQISIKSRKKYLTYHNRDGILSSWDNLYKKLMERT